MTTIAVVDSQGADVGREGRLGGEPVEGVVVLEERGERHEVLFINAWGYLGCVWVCGGCMWVEVCVCVGRGMYMGGSVCVCMCACTHVHVYAFL